MQTAFEISVQEDKHVIYSVQTHSSDRTRSKIQDVQATLRSLTSCETVLAEADILYRKLVITELLRMEPGLAQA